MGVGPKNHVCFHKLACPYFGCPYHTSLIVCNHGSIVGPLFSGNSHIASDLLFQNGTGNWTLWALRSGSWRGKSSQFRLSSIASQVPKYRTLQGSSTQRLECSCGYYTVTPRKKRGHSQPRPPNCPLLNLQTTK